MSHLDEEGAEWETRKISLFGAAKSFVSQLSVGQDLTRVSLPSVFLYPYSALELGASRSLSYIELLSQANYEEDPVKRFLSVLRWFLCCTQKEKFDKKPYNPILGETHTCWVESKQGQFKYHAEQVSHHPPVTAYTVVADKEQLSFLSNISFSIKFHGNSVSIRAEGPFKMNLNKLNEEYIFSKTLPDVSVKNVILGTKRVSWDGDVVIECKKTNLKATMTFKEEGWSNTNVVYGSIINNSTSTVLYDFGGPCGGIIEISSAGDRQLNDKKNKKKNVEGGEVLVDVGSLNKNKIKYPSKEEMDPLASLNVWREVSEAIIEDDMQKADAAKRLVEDEQRKNRNENKDTHVPRYFKFDSNSGFWEFLGFDATKESIESDSSKNNETSAFEGTLKHKAGAS